MHFSSRSSQVSCRQQDDKHAPHFYQGRKQTYLTRFLLCLRISRVFTRFGDRCYGSSDFQGQIFEARAKHGPSGSQAKPK